MRGSSGIDEELSFQRLGSRTGKGASYQIGVREPCVVSSEFTVMQNKKTEIFSCSADSLSLFQKFDQHQILHPGSAPADLTKKMAL